MEPTAKRYLTGGLAGLATIAALATYIYQERRIDELENRQDRRITELEETLRWMLKTDMEGIKEDK